MKKLGILLMAFLFSWSLIQGQTKESKSSGKPLKKLEGTTVSQKAKDNFRVDFPNATNPEWARLGTFDQVSFTGQAGKKMIAYYDYDGMLAGTTQSRSFADLPAKAQQEIKSKYKDYTVGTVIFFEDNKLSDTDMVLYGIQFDDADNYFVELSKGASKIVLKVSAEGEVFFYKQM